MKAVTWHGRRDVRVEDVPDPIIEEATDAIIRDHVERAVRFGPAPLRDPRRPSWTRATCSATSRWASSRRSGTDVGTSKVGDRVVIPSRSPAATAGCATSGLYTQCETTQVRDQGMGAALFGYSKLYGEVPGGQAELLRVPQAQFMPIKVPEGPPDERFLFLSDVLPPPGRRWTYADIPDGGTLLVLGLGPIGDMAARIALHQGFRVIARGPGARAARARPRSRGAEVIDLTRRSTTSPTRSASRTEGRGADSVIDAVGMEAHGSPVAAAGPAERRRCCPTRLAASIMEQGGHRPDGRALHRHRHRPSRRNGLAHRRVRRPGRPDADADDVRQADPAPDGPGQRQAVGRRHHAAARRRRRPARRRAVRHAHRAARRGARRPTRSSRRSRTAPSRSSSSPDEWS